MNKQTLLLQIGIQLELRKARTIIFEIEKDGDEYKAKMYGKNDNGERVRFYDTLDEALEELRKKDDKK